MDYTAKKKVLENLARVDAPKAAAALSKEAETIASVMANETNYDVLEGNIELLDAFAFRVYEKAFSAVQILLNRLSSLSLTYNEVPGFPAERMKKYHNSVSLTVRLLTLLEHIRYHLPEQILQVFLDYSIHSEELVQKKATDGLKTLSGFDLEIFYGDGKNWKGLGCQPQEKVLDYIYFLNPEQRKKYFTAIVTICDKLLSPSISGSAWSYMKVTLQTGALPASPEIKVIRQRTLDLLISMYKVADSSWKKRIITSTLKSATQSSHAGKYGDDVLAMLCENTIQVLKFYQHIVSVETDMEIVQHIEHMTYWLHHNREDNSIRAAALEVKKAIDVIPEYQIFKVLIGYEGVFAPWRAPEPSPDKEQSTSEHEYRRTEELRNKQTKVLAESVNVKNFSEWEERIIRYSKIESNDMATFPFFGKFLEQFAKSSPDLAMKLLTVHAEELKWFIPPILSGVWETPQKDALRTLLNEWVIGHKYLAQVARLFEFSNDVDVDLVKLIVKAATDDQDEEIAIPALRQIIAVVAANFGRLDVDTVNTLLSDTILSLNAKGDGRGILNIWFRKEIDELVSVLNESTLAIIMDNLLLTTEIKYEAERILSAIADRHPKLVIEFFGKRIQKEMETQDEAYSAIPFQFQSLQRPLSRNLDLVIDEVSHWYDRDEGLFTFRGGKLLHNIFPDYSEAFANKLLALVQSGDRRQIEIVMAILRNYQGIAGVQPLCLEIVKVLPSGDELLNEVAIIIWSTGVVAGPFGFAEAYERKLVELESWLHDDNEKVQTFALSIQDNLHRAIAQEKARAEEQIKLQKFKYGEEPKDTDKT